MNMFRADGVSGLRISTANIIRVFNLQRTHKNITPIFVRTRGTVSLIFGRPREIAFAFYNDSRD